MYGLVLFYIFFNIYCVVNLFLLNAEFLITRIQLPILNYLNKKFNIQSEYSIIILNNASEKTDTSDITEASSESDSRDESKLDTINLVENNVNEQLQTDEFFIEKSNSGRNNFMKLGHILFDESLD